MKINEANRVEYMRDKTIHEIESFKTNENKGNDCWNELFLMKIFTFQEI